MSMVLKPLIEGKEKSPRIVIEDNIHQNGRGLLKAFLCQQVKRVDSVHVLLNEVSQEHFISGLPTDVLTRVEFHDCSADPLGWHGNQVLSLDTDLVSYLHGKIPTNHNAVLVVIDSLSPVLLSQSSPHTCKTLYGLTSCKGRPDLTLSVIALVHGDLHDDLTLTLVHHSATSVLTVEPPRQPDATLLCHVLHKKLSGKVINNRTHVSLSDDFSIQSVQDFNPLVEATETNSSVPDPAANLTFNLTLNDREKEARSNLQLPYTHKRSDPSSVSLGSGKIFYQPDDADDFDEEDPDDDLDI